MRARLLFFLSIALIASAVITMIGIVGPVGAEQQAIPAGLDGYTVGSVTANPRDAYYGDTVNLVGSGHIKDATLTVMLAGVDPDDDQFYYAVLGDTVSDSEGNWSFEFQVPTTVTRNSDGATVTTQVADWPVEAVTMQYGAAYDSYTYVNILGWYSAPAPADPVTANTTGTTVATNNTSNTTASKTLPATGTSVVNSLLLALALLLAGHLCLAGAVRTWSKRRQ